MLPTEYLYISSTQVEQLTAEMRGDSPAAAGVEPLAHKLAAAVRHVEAQEPVGTIEKPGAYFRGTLKMQWGIVDETALFVGEQAGEERLFVLLGGPAGAALAAGEAARSRARIPTAALAGLFALFERADPDAAVPEHHYMAPDNLDARLLRRLPWLAEQLDAVQTVTFLAKTLSVMASDDRYSSARDILVVGSPLYVAVSTPAE